MGFAVRVRSAGQKYGPTCHQRDRADVAEFVTLVRLSSLGQHVGVLALAGYKRRKSALTASPIIPIAAILQISSVLKSNYNMIYVIWKLQRIHPCRARHDMRHNQVWVLNVKISSLLAYCWGMFFVIIITCQMLMLLKQHQFENNRTFFFLAW